MNEQIKQKEKKVEEWSNRYHYEYLKDKWGFLLQISDKWLSKESLHQYMIVFWNAEMKNPFARCWDQVFLFWQITIQEQEAELGDRALH